MTDDPIERYELENLRQPEAEVDLFTIERYQQFTRHMPAGVRVALDVGCSTGRGGLEINRIRSDVELWGLDVVQERLESLPRAYTRKIRGLSTAIPIDDGSVDVVLAGEFLEHLMPRDVDMTICEFQRVLTVGGRLILTTPNPSYVRLRLTGMSVYGPGHLTQHHAHILRTRLKMHGFANVHVRGSGRMSRHLGEHFPILPLYGSYLMRGDKK
jgi:ubiquinone/menaquinone biosynthesis C-methylase UbiE